MPFQGPGVYEIVPIQAKEMFANSWGGDLKAGAQVKLYPRDSSDPHKNSIWQFALVGGFSDASEYLIINVLTGYFLTATAEGTAVSTPQISPTDPTARWRITTGLPPFRDIFTINCALESRGQLNTNNGAMDKGTEIIAYGLTGQDSAKWQLVRRPDAFS
ncbi:ricin B lectin domain-containing protein [Xylaria palmicola]|nr:ricin B lectin domain-containing protein [Xylaria palmicola]